MDLQAQRLVVSTVTKQTGLVKKPGGGNIHETLSTRFLGSDITLSTQKFPQPTV